MVFGTSKCIWLEGTTPLEILINGFYSDFLEEKRSRFPRFYFIGDDDLLEILGQAQNPTVIQSHLKKLFAGIHSVTFSEDRKQILGKLCRAHPICAL